jgi:nucleotide-binding universal stress UspA family protein
MGGHNGRQRRVAHRIGGVDNRGVETFRRIVVAFDGSAGARRSLEVALALAERVGAELHAVAVEGHLPHYGATVGEVQEELEMEQTQAAGALAEARRLAEAVGVVVKTEVVAGHPAHAIIEAARPENADLIVIGHAARPGMWSLLPGGTAERVSRHAPCSVLIVR